ncbi:class C sortase [Bifidobacterium sp. ESL0790]|uniref:class C sortase n=1 Tax=Bifidobacterium sp. ESL0790 TaxID=2983233 RepID=UPI0023F69562|nr:class C sortase [Bifidobacterium sp. ESL0790]WEV72889.1 class C sortase [Bifidobacterium sp. ESL0790]
MLETNQATGDMPQTAISSFPQTAPTTAEPVSPLVPPTFAQILEQGKRHYVVIRSKRRFISFLKAMMALCVVTAIALVLWLPANQYVNARQQEAEAVAAMNRVQKWPRGKIAEELAEVQRYNADIAASRQDSMGEFADPFAPGVGATGHKRVVTQSERDVRYQSLLNVGGGVMGVIRIPKISLKLPIYHGTSDEVLDRGAGHLYGTSLPVGGASTNSVLTGHRGRPNTLLFTRLDQLDKGDVVYINALDHTFGYQITAIHVVKPTDTHLYKVVPGKDLLTLMTCTPYGVNSHRLVLTAERRPIPKAIPYPDDARGDGVLRGSVTALALLALGVLALVVAHRRKWPMRHATRKAAGK